MNKISLLCALIVVSVVCASAQPVTQSKNTPNILVDVANPKLVGTYKGVIGPVGDIGIGGGLFTVTMAFNAGGYHDGTLSTTANTNFLLYRGRRTALSFPSNGGMYVMPMAPVVLPQAPAVGATSGTSTSRVINGYPDQPNNDRGTHKKKNNKDIYYIMESAAPTTAGLGFPLTRLEGVLRYRRAPGTLVVGKTDYYTRNGQVFIFTAGTSATADDVQTLMSDQMTIEMKRTTRILPSFMVPGKTYR